MFSCQSRAQACHQVKHTILQLRWAENQETHTAEGYSMSPTGTGLLDPTCRLAAGALAHVGPPRDPFQSTRAFPAAPASSGKLPEHQRLLWWPYLCTRLRLRVRPSSRHGAGSRDQTVFLMGWQRPRATTELPHCTPLLWGLGSHSARCLCPHSRPLLGCFSLVTFIWSFGWQLLVLFWFYLSCQGAWILCQEWML